MAKYIKQTCTSCGDNFSIMLESDGTYKARPWCLECLVAGMEVLTGKAIA